MLCMYVYMSICLYVYMSVCICVSLYLCIFVSLYLCIFVSMCVYVCTIQYNTIQDKTRQYNTLHYIHIYIYLYMSSKFLWLHVKHPKSFRFQSWVSRKVEKFLKGIRCVRSWIHFPTHPKEYQRRHQRIRSSCALSSAFICMRDSARGL